ncbi:hypothetical protein OHS18_30985 [Amycolatopsis sp. NBC_00355]|uniref:hypothetical protein n=1 Tax=Amycolatopsis sp. NBC_00355 TaxID=2975957 RepID=UPI002E263D1C
MPQHDHQPQPATSGDPAGQPVELTVNVLTDGLGRFYVPVFLARPDGTAELVGVDIYDELEAAVRDGQPAPDA